MIMEPQVLYSLSARTAGQTMSDYTYSQHVAPSRPRKPRPTFPWSLRRR